MHSKYFFQNYVQTAGVYMEVVALVKIDARVPKDTMVTDVIFLVGSSSLC